LTPARPLFRSARFAALDTLIRSSLATSWLTDAQEAHTHTLAKRVGPLAPPGGAHCARCKQQQCAPHCGACQLSDVATTPPVPRAPINTAPLRRQRTTNAPPTGNQSLVVWPRAISIAVGLPRAAIEPLRLQPRLRSQQSLTLSGRKRKRYSATKPNTNTDRLHDRAPASARTTHQSGKVRKRIASQQPLRKAERWGPNANTRVIANDARTHVCSKQHT
jgi:hypothetical protein